MIDRKKLEEILYAVACGELSPQLAVDKFKSLPYQDLGFAKVDLYRSLNQGLPEVIFCPGKTNEQIVKIAQELKTHHDVVLATRIEQEQAASVLPFLTGSIYHDEARLIVWGAVPHPGKGAHEVAIVTAGTADLGVAEEAALILAASAIPIERLYDVGVAGIHRLLSNFNKISKAAVIIVVAGMDGALPSVVAGLVDKPVIAVPTSIGYGASFKGLAALLSMLNSCAPGLMVVNIDNGFGAASAALRIISSLERASKVTNHLSTSQTSSG